MAGKDRKNGEVRSTIFMTIESILDVPMPTAQDTTSNDADRGLEQNDVRSAGDQPIYGMDRGTGKENHRSI